MTIKRQLLSCISKSTGPQKISVFKKKGHVQYLDANLLPQISYQFPNEKREITHSSQASVFLKIYPHQKWWSGGREGGESMASYYQEKLCLLVKLRNFISHTIHLLVSKFLHTAVFSLIKIKFSIWDYQNNRSIFLWWLTFTGKT